MPGWLMLVAAMTAVGPVSIDMYLPGFRAIESEFGQRGVEGTMAAYLLGVAFGQLQIALGRPAEDHVWLDRDLALIRDFDELGLIVGHM